jgi:hypothetical protein
MVTFPEILDTIKFTLFFPVPYLKKIRFNLRKLYFSSCFRREKKCHLPP